MEEKLYCHYLNEKERITTVELNASKKNPNQNYYDCFYGVKGYKQIRDLDLDKVFENTFDGCIGVFTKDKKPNLSICLITNYLKKKKEDKQKKYEEKLNKLDRKIKNLEDECIEREE